MNTSKGELVFMKKYTQIIADYLSGLARRIYGILCINA